LPGGGFNKVYTVSASGDNDGDGDGEDVASQLPYIFRVTLPVEPFYKTASEVATISYVREHTHLPVPRIIAHSPIADNELGFEWMLMEKIPGVFFGKYMRWIWRQRKERRGWWQRYFKKLQDRCTFDVIGNLYFREDLLDKCVRMVSTTDERFVIGPIVTGFMYAGGRKLHVPRNWYT
jgi:hypothetical protein